ncbi:replication-relaxation family protein [Nonomuraea sp. NPDC050556]|uniref:replication-relaxation family protein n=1 Tax=Nonomuraea sp. NPDC050556 TaxID=3364369 RepID=UPI00378AF3A8
MRRHSPQSLVRLAARLTDRDRQLLHIIQEQRVLTLAQLALMFFDNEDLARKRLRTLHDLGLLERFRPRLPMGMGTAPYHYVIGPAGAAVLSAQNEGALSTADYQAAQTLAISQSQRLAHTIGVNGFGAALRGLARRSTTAELLQWWPESRCRPMWGDIVRPDAYGRWRENGLTFDFFLEYDTGSESLGRVAGKLADYQALAESTGLTTVVLFSLHSRQREANLRRKLTDPPVPVATGVRGVVDDSPAGEEWLPADTKGTRMRLSQLATHWPHLRIGK